MASSQREPPKKRSKPDESIADAYTTQDEGTYSAILIVEGVKLYVIKEVRNTSLKSEGDGHLCVIKKLRLTNLTTECVIRTKKSVSSVAPSPVSPTYFP